MILIAYDGSDDAKAAIEQAGKLFAGQSVTVLTVWQRFIDTMARVGGGMGMIADYDEIDGEAEKQAGQQAAEGAKLASDAGLEASSASVVVDTTVADAILNEATRRRRSRMRQPRLHRDQVADARQRLEPHPAAREHAGGRRPFTGGGRGPGEAPREPEIERSRMGSAVGQFLY